MSAQSVNVGFEIDFEDGDLEVYFLEEEEVELE